MSRGVNKVFLIGNLGKDPEIKFFPNGDAFCSLSIATSESWTDKATGEKKERAEWHNLIFTQRLAEVVGEYLKKGSKIYVEGSLRTRKWQDKEGNERYTTEIVVREMQMLDSYSAGGDPQARQPQSGAAEYAAASGRSTRPARAGLPVAGGDEFVDDSIPF